MNRAGTIDRDGTIRWGIVGCGDVCEVKSGPALQKASGSALVAVMRRDLPKAADYAKRHHVARWYDDADALIADEQVDAVYIATPPDSHRDLALKVARAGKACLVEKPMARNAAECREMVEAFERANCPLFVAYYRRALPVFVRVRELVRRGSIGRITSIDCRFCRATHRGPSPGWRVDPAVSGGGLFVDLASHGLNALEWILGNFIDVRGDAARLANAGPAEDVTSVTWRCAYGAFGRAVYNFASAVNEDVLEITGTDARLSWSCFGDGTLTITHAGGNVEVERHPNPPHVHQPLVQTIVDQLRGVGQCPSDARSAMRTSQHLDAALAGFYGR